MARLMTMKLHLKRGRSAILISAYAPTMSNDDADQEAFYDHLSSVLLCKSRFRFDLDDILHGFFELRSISRHFGPFRALFKVLPISELYFRAADLDLVHPVFLLKAILAIHVRYGDNADQNKAKKSVQGALEAKPKVEIWRRHVFLTQRPRLVLRSKVGQSTQLLPV